MRFLKCIFVIFSLTRLFLFKNRVVTFVLNDNFFQAKGSPKKKSPKKEGSKSEVSPKKENSPKSSCGTN